MTDALDDDPAVGRTQLDEVQVLCEMHGMTLWSTGVEVVIDHPVLGFAVIEPIGLSYLAGLRLWMESRGLET